MKDKITFQTKTYHRVCIHLKPEHYHYLKKLSRNFDKKISKTIIYLVSKYLKYLYKIKISNKKKTLTTTYQPKTKEYKKFWIYIEPTKWGKLRHLKFYLGYSMSFIIRIMIEWEMAEEAKGRMIDIIIKKPILSLDELKEIPSGFLHHYKFFIEINLQERFVSMRFKDKYY